MNTHDHNSDTPLPPQDDLDALLRAWHESNRDRAAQGRDRLMAALKSEDAADALADTATVIEAKPAPEHAGRDRSVLAVIRRAVASRYAPLAAAAVAIACVLPFMLPGKGTPLAVARSASNVVMAPEGGLLEARDADGNSLGPCTLAHTDVHAEISGRFSRVTLKQRYTNPHKDKVEAVYTFPLSHRAGVDRMSMTIGDRVIVGEVKERQAARQIYEAARQANRIASLLEQERPNIFTQSVANIEPGATIDIEISYVELVKESDGQYAFEFPTVVGPRYIPGAETNPSPGKSPALPDGVQRRAGLVLLAPATISNVTTGEGTPLSAPPSGLLARLEKAIPIQPRPHAEGTLPQVALQTDYVDGFAEPAVLYADGTGIVGTRWFYCPPAPSEPTPVTTAGVHAHQDQASSDIPSPKHDPRSQAFDPGEAPVPGTPFAGATAQVPDAQRITPTPTRPPTRAGHDLSITVTLDTGGPGLTSVDSALHRVTRTDLGTREDGLARRTSITLANQTEIPNRDFVLTWKQTNDTITDAIFTNTGPHGNFFCIQLDPPARVSDAQAVPRELVFVLDTSGSMSGLPMAKSREIMQKAIDAMRPHDTFNLMTFAGETKVLWPEPRPSTPENRQIAQAFISTLEGGGGTEMMKAINAALTQKPNAAAVSPLLPGQLADLPADGREVAVRVEDHQLSMPRDLNGRPGWAERCAIAVRGDLVLDCTDFKLPEGYGLRVSERPKTGAVALTLRGRWSTASERRVLEVSSAEFAGASPVRPLRLVMFLTDGYVGNDMAIIDAIRKNRATTRVFAFGIGNSVNRYLLDNMAAAGGGEVEYVLIDSQNTSTTEANAAQAVERFNRRTATPVLTDIRVTFSPDLKPVDMLPDATVFGGGIPDLFDAKPVIIVGRYTAHGAGTITITGQTASGAWEKSIQAVFPAADERNTSLPTVWARAKIESLMNQDLAAMQTQQVDPQVRDQIIALGESFGVMSAFTSFVAVDKLRITVAGRPRLVNIPIELPDSTRWEGFFGAVGGERLLEAPLNSDQPQQLTLPSNMLDMYVQTNLDIQTRRRGMSTMGSDFDASAPDDAGGTHAGMAFQHANPMEQSPPPGNARPDSPRGTGAPGAALPTAPTATHAPASPPSVAPSTPSTGTVASPPSAATPKEKTNATRHYRQGTTKVAEAEQRWLEESKKDEPVQRSADVRNFNPVINGPAQMQAPTDALGGPAGSAGSTVRLGRRLSPMNTGENNIALAIPPNENFACNSADFARLEGGVVSERYAQIHSGIAPPPEVNVLAAAQLAQSSRLADARAIVCDTPNDTNYEPWTTLCKVLTEVPPQEQALPFAQAEQVVSIQRRVQNDMLEQARQAKILRTLENSIHSLARGSDAKSRASSSDPVAVVILLTDLDAATLEKLKALGITIETTNSASKVVVARVPVNKLSDLALLPAVRRVEPVPENP